MCVVVLCQLICELVPTQANSLLGRVRKDKYELELDSKIRGVVSAPAALLALNNTNNNLHNMFLYDVLLYFLLLFMVYE